jgi:single-stranded-DNA-specific exonuclease
MRRWLRSRLSDLIDAVRAKCSKSAVMAAAFEERATPDGTPSPPSALPERCGSEARKLAAALGVTTTLGDWLLQRKLSDIESARRFLSPKLASLSTPDGMADRAIAAERLARAVRARERVVVFGDYDCDGMTSAAILTQILQTLGGDVETLIASRFAGGYGVSPAALGRIRAARPGLVVTCDCGSSDHERLAELTRSGVDVIVIDHHLVPDEPLPALAFLNPHRKDCGFQYKGLASCGLALSIGAALRTALGKELDLRQWLDLVAIGTIADVAPLDGDNRALVRAGLRVIGEARRPGVRALLANANIDLGSPLTAEDVAFRIAPRLNAPGRLGAPDAALELLLATDADAASTLAARVEQASTERKELQKQLLLEAIAEIERERYAERPAIVLGREGWNHGIVGIVAGRIAELYSRPVVIAAFEDGRGRGSVRGPTGARLHDALSRSAHALVRFGGHQAAAGVELELARLAEFREAFEAAVTSLSGEPSRVTDTPREAVWLAGADEPTRVLKDFALLEPCGLTNPLPRLLVEANVVSAREVTGGHLKLELELDARQRLSGFGVALGGRAATLSGRVIAQGRLRADRYRGGDAVELHVEQLIELR